MKTESTPIKPPSSQPSTASARQNPRQWTRSGGEGNRQAHLDKLAARGYTIVFSTPGGPCYLRNRTRAGDTTPG